MRVQTLSVATFTATRQSTSAPLVSDPAANDPVGVPLMAMPADALTRIEQRTIRRPTWQRVGLVVWIVCALLLVSGILPQG